MDILAAQLRERAQQLGISNSEAARLCGLDERRYAHYAAGRREPDLATLVRIAASLGTTPNSLLGLSSEGAQLTSRSNLIERLLVAAKSMPERELKTVVTQAEALVRHGK